MRGTIQRFGWVLPGLALVGGGAVLAPTLLAAVAAPVPPAVAGAEPTALLRPADAAPAVVDGRDWQVMRRKGSSRGPK